MTAEISTNDAACTHGNQHFVPAAAAAAAAAALLQVDCEVGRPKVNYRETIQARAEFNYLHKKQSGGSGEAAAVAIMGQRCIGPGHFSYLAWRYYGNAACSCTLHCCMMLLARLPAG
jgi:hypothetical protein